jgi:dienelactone hydrolase
MDHRTGDAPAWAHWLAQAELAPDFEPASTRDAFERQRAEIRATAWKLLGALPPRPASPSVRVISNDGHDGCRIERVAIDNAAGSTIPGVLFLPQSRRPGPAILWHHSHGGDYENGCSEVFQENPTPCAPGPALAAEGYTVLSIDACCFGEREGEGPGGSTERGQSGEHSAAKLNLWLGRTLWGMMVRDDLIALDYLSTRAEVDRERIGAAGMSMGATRTWWLMALDDRVKAGVGVCCLTRYLDLIEAQALHEHGLYYFVPGMLRHFDTEALIACIAPRAFLSLAGELDPGSPVAGIRVIERAASAAWSTCGAPDAFQSRIYPATAHTFTHEMWLELIASFRRHL